MRFFTKQYIIFSLFILSNPSFAQQKTIEGKVVNTLNEAIPFATVYLDSTYQTTTDINGKFIFHSVSEGNHIISISCIGFETITQVIDTEKQSSILISLKEKTAELNPIVVSATRSERDASKIPIPITVITKEQIKNMGALRLNDVLTEQTGLTLTSNHGTGVQMQGLGTEYTLILIDGEPIIGRAAGTLELNRLSVGNIKQIEIIKGPSSSLYGSEALAGVINIITEKPTTISDIISTRYGTNCTMDLSNTLNYQNKKLGIYTFINRYNTDGYDLSKETIEKTVNPFTNYTFQTKFLYDLSDRIKLSISGRYFTENQYGDMNIGTQQTPEVLAQKTTSADWNLNPVFSFQLSNRWKITSRWYGSEYKNYYSFNYKSNGKLYEEEFFNQHLYKNELQSEYTINSKNRFTVGLGKIWEIINATRYENLKHQQTSYIYLQYESQILSKLKWIAGGRYDYPSSYHSQLSPKIAVQYDINSWLSINSSVGVGFKAPDFRQLYLSFFNNTVGYSVLGSEELVEGLKKLQQENQIQEILVDPSSLGKINAETSIAYNAGFKLQPTSRLSLTANLFYNSIQDLIDIKPIARKTNGQLVYSYYNLTNVFTKGIETTITFSPISAISSSIGYQFLIAKDKNVINQIANGEIFAKNPQTQSTRRVQKDEYGGLFNRSSHMLTFKILYENKKYDFNVALRMMYRSKSGFADLNNNIILDKDDEYVPGYTTTNLSISKTCWKWVRFQIGCDNLTNYKDPMHIPTLAGRLWWGSIQLTINDHLFKKN